MLRDKAAKALVASRFWVDVLFFAVLVACLDLCSFLHSLVRRSNSLNSVNVAVHTAPTFFATFFSHMTRRSRREGKATQQLSYEEGLMLVKEFLQFAATHTVEELQSFTGKETPTPSWIERKVVEIPHDSLEAAAGLLRTHLEQDDPGLKDVGGQRWWTLRARPLFGEWLELVRDATRRQALLQVGEEAPMRVILYLHGGAHYFAGNGTHRYQIQRHARKLAARAFSVSFRLAPQYPFPCSLHDALAAYLYLISPPPDSGATAIHPSQIMLYGDSSGGGLVLALMVLLRDAALPLPAGSVLISPWVDLTHSFPSVMTNVKGDYIPSHGFHYRPSLAWPPLRGDPMVFRDGEKELDVKEQIQLYCANAMVAHPMVSLVNQGSLGGLPPTLVIGGSEELLADEIVYVAHKAANPQAYPPAEDTLRRYPAQRDKITQYPPTQVHLQMFDTCCHVTTTLSFSRPAKLQYRSAANFSLWALQKAALQLEEQTKHEVEELTKDQKHFDFATQKAAAEPPQNGANSHVKKPHKEATWLPEPNPASPGTTEHVALKGHNGHTDGQNGTKQNGQVLCSRGPELNRSLTGDHDDATLTEAPQEGFMDHSEDSESSDEESDERAANEDSSSSAATPEETEKKTVIVDGPITEEPAADALIESKADVAKPARTTKRQRTISVAGVEPGFTNSIIRERVSVRGQIRAMEPVEEVPALNVPRDSVGRITPDGPIRRWLERRREWDARYTDELVEFRKIRTKDRRKAEKVGYLSREFADENPPLSAVAGVYDQKMAWEMVKGQDSSAGMDGQRERASLGVLLWSKLSAKPDEEQAGKRALDNIAAKGDRKLPRRPSSILSPDIEKDLQFEQ